MGTLESILGEDVSGASDIELYFPFTCFGYCSRGYGMWWALIRDKGGDCNERRNGDDNGYCNRHDFQLIFICVPNMLFTTTFADKSHTIILWGNF